MRVVILCLGASIVWCNALGVKIAGADMTVRKNLLALLSSQPRSVSSLARELGFTACRGTRLYEPQIFIGPGAEA